MNMDSVTREKIIKILDKVEPLISDRRNIDPNKILKAVLLMEQVGELMAANSLD